MDGLPREAPTAIGEPYSRFCSDVLRACNNAPHIINDTLRRRLQTLLTNFEGLRYEHHDELCRTQTGTFRWNASECGWVAAGALRALLNVGQEKPCDAFGTLEHTLLHVSLNPIHTYTKTQCEQALIRLCDAHHYMKLHRGLLEYTNALETRCAALCVCDNPDYKFASVMDTSFYELKQTLLPLGMDSAVKRLHDETPSQWQEYWTAAVQHYCGTSGVRASLKRLLLQDMISPGHVAHYGLQNGEATHAVDKSRAVRQLYGTLFLKLNTVLEIGSIEEISTLLTPRHMLFWHLLAFDAHLFARYRIEGWFAQSVAGVCTPTMLFSSQDIFILVTWAQIICVHQGAFYFVNSLAHAVHIMMMTHCQTDGLLLRRHAIPEPIMSAINDYPPSDSD